MCLILERLHAFFLLGGRKAGNNDSSYYDVCMSLPEKTDKPI